MALPNVDFDSLRLFVHIYRTQSLTKAAELSWITPSGASRTLAKLRELFNDPLFIRVGAQMQPTQRARSLYAPVLETLNRFADLVDPPIFAESFHQKTFRIACYETNVLSTLKTAVMNLVNSGNDQVVLDIRLVGESFWKELETGTLDFAILPVTGSRPSFHIERVCPDPYVWVVDQLHPLVALEKERALTRNDIERYKVVKLQVFTHSSADDGSCLLLNEDTPKHVMIRSSFLMANLGLIMGTPLVAQVPLTTAAVMAPQWGLHILGRSEHGVEHPLSIVWHASKEHDPANQWLRSVIISSVKNLPSLELVPVLADR